MTGCPASGRAASVPPRRGTRWAGVAVAALLVCAAPTLAQQGPIRLSPPPLLKVPQPAPDAPTAAPAESPALKPNVADTKSDISVSPTRALDMDAVGLVDEAHGGLPATLWHGSSRTVVDRLIEALPVPNTSPAGRALAKRVLTSGGPPPAAENDPEVGFATVRAAGLMAMGDIDAATALARAVPRREEDETLSRILLEAALIDYDTAGACQIARDRIGRFDTSYWQKALIFCQALAGEQERAQLGLSMLRERNADDDSAFVRLIYALSGDKRVDSELPKEIAPLHLAMLRAANRQIPETAVERARPTVLRMVAHSPNAKPDVRLAAAARAEAVGALSTRALVQNLEAVEFGPDELAKALSTAEKAPPPRAHAAIYRAAKAQSIGIARAEALRRGWAIARNRGFYPSAVRTTLSLLREISPTSEVAWFAADAGRALLLAGRREDAQTWYDLARNESVRGARTDDSEILLWPLLRLAGGDVAPPDPAGLAAWRAVQHKRDASKMPARSAVLMALLEALGDGTDGSLSALLLAGDLTPRKVAMPSPALWLGRDGAASAGRIGETALFVAATLGPEGPGAWSPHTLIALVQALRAVGLETDARAIALEAAVAAGL